MTIKDIARESGCAIGTVSRVLNNHPDVSEETRKKVLEVVNKYDFVLNTNAKQLKQQERNTIVIIVKGTSSILLNSLLEKIQKKIESMPYTASVVVIDELDNEAKVANRIYYEQKPIGMIFLGGSPDYFEEDYLKTKIPSVIISTETMGVDNSNLSSVSTNNFEACEYSASYLIENGHKKIGVVGGDFQSSGLTQIRYAGFLSAMEKAGISFDKEKQYASAKYTLEGGAEATKELLKKFPDVTAIFTMADVMAMGCIRQLQDMGIKVPDQISVIGFDGLTIVDYFCPRITTIKQKDEELVDVGLKVLIDSIENKAEPVHKFIPFEFVTGESVKKL
ncbi:MAG: LacI family DNA-binding transcriptional regulator [Treponema sp.]|nr:LacI family transcriptional regulator [Spirochaetia bacterium]MDY2840271.1 LacI family DNA-binding transcriptional regulator [Treponema sp.]MDY5124417.1 LacI family DNA-binding transcriptional regulator [Treponema sp.]